MGRKLGLNNQSIDQSKGFVEITRPQSMVSVTFIKRSGGVVRIAQSSGGLNSGIELPIDTPIQLLLDGGDAVYMSSPEIAPQSVDIIQQEPIVDPAKIAAAIIAAWDARINPGSSRLYPDPWS